MGNSTSNPDAAFALDAAPSPAPAPSPGPAPVSPCSTEDPVDQDAATALEPTAEPELVENSDEFEQVLTCIFGTYPFLIFDCGCENMPR